MKINLLKSPVFLLLCFMASLISCGTTNTSDLQAFIESTKTKHVGSVKPIPQFKPYESFVYTAMTLRDPFTPNVELEIESETSSLRPESTRPKEALEAFPLNTLTMVGTLEQKGQVWALIKDPNNSVHRVLPGQHMGRDEGKIISITDNDINLIELISDGLGGYFERNALITIGNE